MQKEHLASRLGGDRFEGVGGHGRGGYGGIEEAVRQLTIIQEQAERA